MYVHVAEHFGKNVTGMWKVLILCTKRMSPMRQKYNIFFNGIRNIHFYALNMQKYLYFCVKYRFFLLFSFAFCAHFVISGRF